MSISVTPLHPHLGAEVRGVDLRRPVAPDVFAEIEAAFNTHAVLVFPGQPLTDDQQTAFSLLFGPLEVAMSYAGENKRLRTNTVTDISNLDDDGNVLSLQDRRRLFNLGNQLWHTDSSFKHVPAKCSLLSAREIPPTGGETEFADMRAAYDALPEDVKRKLDGLIAEHSIFHSRRRLGFSEFDDGISSQLPPVQQLLVRRHPGSGRTGLYLASHASHVIGWPVEEGRKLIDELVEFATRSEFVFSHSWRVGDLVLWDNRCTMHRGRPYDEAKYRRVMHRTTVADVANTVEQERLAASPAA